MVIKADKNKARVKRHIRVRNKICGTAECPRLDVFRSNKNIYAQRAAKAGIAEVVFDRGGYIFHGRVKELAEGAREGGLKF